MSTSRSSWVWLALGCSFALLTSACRTSVVGRYELDLEESLKTVEESAKQYPNLASHKQDTIDRLKSGKLDIVFDENGKMSSTAEFPRLPGDPPRIVKNTGTWKLKEKRLVIMPDEGRDIDCDVDGKRLRCTDDTLPKLMSRFVLVRK